VGHLQKGLPEDVTIDSVEAHFVQYGAVARVNLFRERDTKKPKVHTLPESRREAV
jgi:RNA recognition motif-containing protein